MPARMPLSETDRLPAWQRPKALLYLMVAMPLSFATWSALLSNFVIDPLDWPRHYLSCVNDLPFIAVRPLKVRDF